MTLALQRAARPGSRPPQHATTPAERRNRRWSAGWRAALRLAARDARRHRFASVLIVLMIGLPVLIISAGSAVLATTDVTAAESLPVLVGRGQALIVDEGSGVVRQTPDGEVVSIGDSDAKTVPGHRPGERWTADQLERLTGGTVGLSGRVTAYTTRAGSLTKIDSLVLGRDVLGGSGLVALVSGRLPSASGEVAVTEQGMALGLPGAGPVDLSVSTIAGQARITGVVRAQGPDYRGVGLVLGEEWIAPTDADRFLLVRDRPVTWADVQAWNAYGLSVLSPTVVADPPADAPRQDGTGSASRVALVVLISVGLVLETALLAGPAFAVSAARRRRSLALIASNGAEQEQLTRYVLAQGVVLGGVAVVLGAALGTTFGWTGIRLLSRLLDGHGTTIGNPPLDTYAWVTLTVVGVAFAAAVISAAIPGYRAARLDIATTLAGRTVQRRSPAGLPIAGAAIVAVGVALMAASVSTHGVAGLYAAGFGGALLVIGALFWLPSLLGLVGRGLRRAPAVLRMAARDTTRLRGRTVPAVAAITVVVATLTMIAVSAGSDDAQSRRDYRPHAPYGHGTVYAYGESADTLRQIRTQHPTWRAEPSGRLGTSDDRRDLVSVDAVPPGCTVAEAIGPVPDQEPVDGCLAYRRDLGWQVVVPATGLLNPEARLTATQRAVLDSGGILVTAPALVTDGKVRLAVSAIGSGRDTGGSAAPLSLQRSVTVPAAVITAAQFAALGWTDDPGADLGGAVVLAAGAERSDLPWTPTRWEISDPAGPISRADQSALNAHVVSTMEVERGYESPIRYILLVLFGVAAGLVAVGALVSTALGQIEARADFATLSALGASAGFRRRLAAAQAALIALLGTVLGVLLGIGPGLALARSLTTDYADSAGNYPAPTLAVPWGALGILLVAVPLGCALLAALLVRRTPPITRRPT